MKKRGRLGSSWGQQPSRPKPPLFSWSAATKYIAPFTIVLPTERPNHATTKVLPDGYFKKGCVAINFLIIRRIRIRRWGVCYSTQKSVLRKETTLENSLNGLEYMFREPILLSIGFVHSVNGTLSKMASEDWKHSTQLHRTFILALKKIEKSSIWLSNKISFSQELFQPSNCNVNDREHGFVYTPDCKNVDSLKYFKRWDPLALWVNVYMVITVVCDQ